MHEFRRAGVFGLVWLAVGLGCAYAVDGEENAGRTETIEIPLDQIAGLGRKGLRSLEPDLLVYRDTPEKIKKYSDLEVLQEAQRKIKQHSLVIPIERAMRELPIGKEVKPHAGFAVRGRDRSALPGVHRVLVQGEKPNESFSVDEEVSLVFYSHLAGPLVGLDRVERRDNRIEIHYLLIAEKQAYVSSIIALVPCGKLPTGEYQIKMIRAVAKEKGFNQQEFPPVEAGAEDHIICKPFSFTVVGESSETSDDSASQSHLE